jgi:hypothetical protein
MECMGDCSILLEETVLYSFHSTLELKKNGAIICPLFLSESMDSEKKIGSIILVTVDSTSQSNFDNVM